MILHIDEPQFQFEWAFSHDFNFYVKNSMIHMLTDRFCGKSIELRALASVMVWRFRTMIRTQFTPRVDCSSRTRMALACHDISVNASLIIITVLSISCYQYWIFSSRSCSCYLLKFMWRCIFIQLIIISRLNTLLFSMTNNCVGRMANR